MEGVCFLLFSGVLLACAGLVRLWWQYIVQGAYFEGLGVFFCPK